MNALLNCGCGVKHEILRDPSELGRHKMSIGDKINYLLGKSFKTSKFKTLAKLTIVRIAVLRKNHQSQCSQAMTDVISLLTLGQEHDALLRVQNLIKEQNVLEAFHMIESYCDLLMDNIKVINKNRDCPEELCEAIHTLIYTASRCGGEFCELQKMRADFTKWFGKEFANDAVNLGKNSQVNMSIIPMLSMRPPSLETKKTVLRQIASQNGIVLKIIEEVKNEHPTADIMVQQEDLNVKNLPVSPRESTIEDIPKARRPGQDYQDAADAAQDAYESASYAALAAKAAVELSKSETQALIKNNLTNTA